GNNWTTLGTVAARPAGGGRGRGGFGGGGGAAAANFETDASGRYLRIEFNQLAANLTASIRELSAYPARYEPEYYDVSYKYRLRWNDVPYQPGELKAVAYRGN